MPRIPIDIQCICLKCLKECPADRYQSAGAVRDDLESFLPGKPVSANPVGPLGRWARWGAHHPVFAGLAGSLVLLCTFIFALVAILYFRERVNSDAQRRLRSRSDRLAQVAQDAVDLTVETVVIDDRGLVDALPVSVRKVVAQQVIPYYDQLIARRVQSDPTQVRVARALVNRARLRHALGTPEEDADAVADCRESARLYEQAVQTHQNQFGRAGALVSMAAIVGPQGHFQEGIAHTQAARPFLERLIAAEPANSAYRYSLVLCLSNEGNCRRYLGEQLGASARENESAREFRGAERAYREAIDHAKQLVESHPNLPRYREWLSRSWGNLGDLQLVRSDLDRRSRIDAAGRALRQAKQIAEDLDHDNPDRTSIQDCLATAALNYGTFLKEKGPAAEAAVELERAGDVYGVLHRRHPDQREYGWGIALARASLGATLLQASSIRSATTALVDAARRYDKLVATYPQVLQIATERSETYDGLAGAGLCSGAAIEAARRIAQAFRVRLEVMSAISHASLPQEQKDVALAQAVRKLVADSGEWLGRLWLLAAIRSTESSAPPGHCECVGTEVRFICQSVEEENRASRFISFVYVQAR